MWFVHEQPVCCYTSTQIKEVHHPSQASWKRFLKIASFVVLNPTHFRTCHDMFQILGPVFSFIWKLNINNWKHQQFINSLSLSLCACGGNVILFQVKQQKIMVQRRIRDKKNKTRMVDSDKIAAHTTGRIGINIPREKNSTDNILKQTWICEL